MAESGLRIERFIFNEFGENTYLLYAPKGEGIVIDLGCNSDEEWAQIAAFVEGAECKIKYLLNTHAHLDHLFGVPRGRTAWSAPFLLPRICTASGFNVGYGNGSSAPARNLPEARRCI